MKHRLVVGTINRWPPEEGWDTVHLDVSPRGIWHHTLEISLQPEFVGDAANMHWFRDAMFDEVVMHHSLEHLTVDDAQAALNGCCRILVTGGVLDIEVPDLDRVVSAYVADELDLPGTSQWLLGEQLPHHEVGDSHRSVWTETRLRAALEVEGFVVHDREETGLALRFRAVKA